MTTHEVAKRLHELCLQGQFETAQHELYADDAASTETNMQGERETTTGMAAILEKGATFQRMIVEIHACYASEPKIYGNYVFMELGMDVTMKEMGQLTMTEMCKYEVKEGKIISEEFFF